jgi:hypothetical protein
MKKNSEPSEPKERTGKDEMNLIEHPIALLVDRRKPDQKAIHCQVPVRGKNGQIVKATWRVTGSEEYGLPFAGDEDIILVLLELTKEQGFRSRTVNFSRYELIRQIKGEGFNPGGTEYRRVEDALRRLNGVSIETDHWWDNRLKRYGTYGFHILEDYALFEEPSGPKAKRGQLPMRASFITWDKHLFDSFTAGYIKSIDLSRYFALTGAVSKRLYRYLDKKFYDGKPKFEIGLRLLAHEHIGVSRKFQYDSRIRQAMEKAHEELVAVGFLSGVEYRETPEGLNVIYYPPSRYIPLPNPNNAPHPLREALCAHGVTADTADRLLMEHGEDKVRKQLECFPYRRAKTNPSGLLIDSIEKDYPPPAAYDRALRAEEERRKKREVQSQVDELEAERKRRLSESRSALTPEKLQAVEERAVAVARQKHPKPGQLAEQGKGIGVWKKLVAAELDRILLED